MQHVLDIIVEVLKVLDKEKTLLMKHVIPVSNSVSIASSGRPAVVFAGEAPFTILKQRRSVIIFRVQDRVKRALNNTVTSVLTRCGWQRCGQIGFSAGAHREALVLRNHIVVAGCLAFRN